MNQTTNTTRRQVSAKELRRALNTIVEKICSASDRFPVALRGNTINLYVDGGSINITINEPKKGGSK